MFVFTLPYAAAQKLLSGTPQEVTINGVNRMVSAAYTGRETIHFSWMEDGKRQTRTLVSGSEGTTLATFICDDKDGEPIDVITADRSS